MKNSPSPSPPGKPIKESYKSYAMPGFIFGSVVRLMHHQHSNPRALVRTSTKAAFRMGVTGAVRTPIFICMERSLAARRGQSDWVSVGAALLGSYFPCMVFPRILTLPFRLVPLPVGPNMTRVRFGACGIPYWFFVWSLIKDHEESLMSPEELRSLYQGHHGFDPGFLRDFGSIN